MEAVWLEHERDECFSKGGYFDDSFHYLDRDTSFNGIERGCSKEEEFSSHWYSEDSEDEGTDVDGYESFDNAQVDPETLKQLLRSLVPTVNTPPFLFV